MWPTVLAGVSFPFAARFDKMVVDATGHEHRPLPLETEPTNPPINMTARFVSSTFGKSLVGTAHTTAMAPKPMLVETRKVARK